ncbi:MAG: hypothetical protein LBC23_00675 [Coriobacteriales bacterium]|jgi:hypothetical protein|nr:hypothetical protein [Coriobacteriales bacterium]
MRKDYKNMTENNTSPILPNLNPLPGSIPPQVAGDASLLPPGRREAGGVRAIHLIIISALLAALLVVNVIALILQFVTPTGRMGGGSDMPVFSQEQQFQGAPSGGDFLGRDTTGDSGAVLTGADHV